MTKIEPERYKGKPLLFNCRMKLADLPLMEEELALTSGVYIETITWVIRRDMHIEQKALSAFGTSVTVSQSTPS